MMLQTLAHIITKMFNLQPTQMFNLQPTKMLNLQPTKMFNLQPTKLLNLEPQPNWNRQIYPKSLSWRLTFCDRNAGQAWRIGPLFKMTSVFEILVFLGPILKRNPKSKVRMSQGRFWLCNQKYDLFDKFKTEITVAIIIMSRGNVHILTDLIYFNFWVPTAKSVKVRIEWLLQNTSKYFNKTFSCVPTHSFESPRLYISPKWHTLLRNLSKIGSKGLAKES